MPRKTRKKKRTPATRINRSISGVDTTQRVPGKVLLSITATSTVIPLALDSLGARLTALGNVFQEHRFLWLKVVLHPGYTTAAGATRAPYVVGYYKVPPATPPTTMANLYSAAASRLSDIGDTVPVSLALGSGVLLHTTRPWFINSVPPGSESLDNTQGVIYCLSSAATFVVNLEVSYLCELRGATLPATD